MGKNIASGNDRVAVQVGRVAKGGGSTKKSSTTTTGSTGVTGETVNIRTGNAHVGEQVDEVHGGINLRS